MHSNVEMDSSRGVPWARARLRRDAAEIELVPVWTRATAGGRGLDGGQAAAARTFASAEGGSGGGDLALRCRCLRGGAEPPARRGALSYCIRPVTAGSRCSSPPVPPSHLLPQPRSAFAFARRPLPPPASESRREAGLGERVSPGSTVEARGGGAESAQGCRRELQGSPGAHPLPGARGRRGSLCWVCVLSGHASASGLGTRRETQMCRICACSHLTSWAVPEVTGRVFSDEVTHTSHHGMTNALPVTRQFLRSRLPFQTSGHCDTRQRHKLMLPSVSTENRGIKERQTWAMAQKGEAKDNHTPISRKTFTDVKVFKSLTEPCVYWPCSPANYLTLGFPFTATCLRAQVQAL
ncbi:uncharacterized protein [Symphalangus syndactylus]|uniref:uncharacterized protein n=1 Tax=Symphalangus syndactylus TaxID=9590 RepID=UPI0030071181